MILGADKYSWRDWCVTFTFQTKSVCNLPTINAANACIHMQERHWLPSALARGLNVAVNAEPTIRKSSERSQRSAPDFPHKHAACELASATLSSWVWTSSISSDAFVLSNDNVPANAYQLLTAFIIFLEMMWQWAVLLTYDTPFIMNDWMVSTHFKLQIRRWGKGLWKERQTSDQFHLTNDLIGITPGVKCPNTPQPFMTGSENSISNWSYSDNLGRQNVIIQLGI